MTGTSISRREYLTSVGGAMVSGAAGCLSTSGKSVRVLAAGSFARAFDDYINPAFKSDTGITVHGEYYGSNAIMRMIKDRTQHPDVIVSADATLLREKLYSEFTDWDIELATNTLGLGYNKETSFGRHLHAGQRWYKGALDTDDGDIALADPNLDPLGYRAVQAFKLAEQEHGIDGLHEQIMDRVYTEPEEPQMLAGVETGSRAAALVYRNMAVDHEIPFVEFPDAYNFSNPRLADQYSTVTYTTDDGYTASGRPILYNATVKDNADNPKAGKELLQYLIGNPGILEKAGLKVTESLPRSHGTPPEEIDI